MDSSNSSFILWLNRWLIIFSVAIVLSPPSVSGNCFTSIFNFGDSLSDTGNLFHDCHSNKPPNSCFPPYGDTFFRRPTGRFSDGRLIIDFIGNFLLLIHATLFCSVSNLLGLRLCWMYMCCFLSSITGTSTATTVSGCECGKTED